MWNERTTSSTKTLHPPAFCTPASSASAIKFEATLTIAAFRRSESSGTASQVVKAANSLREVCHELVRPEQSYFAHTSEQYCVSGLESGLRHVGFCRRTPASNSDTSS